jgi:hypothetical protein
MSNLDLEMELGKFGYGSRMQVKLWSVGCLGSISDFLLAFRDCDVTCM